MLLVFLNVVLVVGVFLNCYWGLPFVFLCLFLTRLILVVLVVVLSYQLLVQAVVLFLR